ncbi:alanine racemase [Desmospora activa]|uniref:Alanine racemase-like protein n=1 Tax=Desmospora activa DSM 45169 TaxID=1121389 RepID=A0A2T4Z8M5_9BACL|nr:alanine racemase [Desmospora activa]PTM58228.1 alanine racemase-like protein [Desmospora activa DSM 45169]
MSLTLYLNRNDWLRHLAETESRFPRFIPVIKGNGYGFGNEFLVGAAQRAGKRSIAVGTVEEARQLEGEGSFDQVLILTPVLTELEADDLRSERIYTIGSRRHLDHLVQSFQRLIDTKPNIWRDHHPEVRVVIKLQSTMKRYGFPLQEADTLEQLETIGQEAGLSIRIEGYAIHFPKDGMSAAAKETQLESWLKHIPTEEKRSFFVSHLSSAQYLRLREKYPQVDWVMRLGTDLWLKDKSFVDVRATVLDIQPISRGERFGYKQRKARKNGSLVYVAGGSANGVGLEAPVSVRGLKDMLKLTAFWLLHILNRHLSPFTFQGKRTWFAEPPHMQTSVLFFPAGAALPEVGEELPVQLRMTTATFDRYVEEGAEEKEAPPLSSAAEETNQTLGATS